MHVHPHHRLTILVDGHRYPVSDCVSWRLDQAPSCAKGFDLTVHPCDGCASYLKRQDDPLKGAQSVLERTVSTRVVKVEVPAEEPKKQPGLIAKAVSWVRAEASALLKPLSEEQYQRRVDVCRSCPELDPLPDPKVGYCKACGCGKRARAELTVKGRMPAATCPRKKWEV